jgi:hypothetical protein
LGICRLYGCAHQQGRQRIHYYMMSVHGCSSDHFSNAHDSNKHAYLWLAQ